MCPGRRRRAGARGWSRPRMIVHIVVSGDGRVLGCWSCESDAQRQVAAVAGSTVVATRLNASVARAPTPPPTADPKQ
jgi:delta 1-pyrroline-5-carboxylate dehydrogenase